MNSVRYWLSRRPIDLTTSDYNAMPDLYSTAFIFAINDYINDRDSSLPDIGLTANAVEAFVSSRASGDNRRNLILHHLREPETCASECVDREVREKANREMMDIVRVVNGYLRQQMYAYIRSHEIEDCEHILLNSSSDDFSDDELKLLFNTQSDGPVRDRCWTELKSRNICPSAEELSTMYNADHYDMIFIDVKYEDEDEAEADDEDEDEDEADAEEEEADEADKDDESEEWMGFLDEDEDGSIRLLSEEENFVHIVRNVTRPDQSSDKYGMQIYALVDDNQRSSGLYTEGQALLTAENVLANVGKGKKFRRFIAIHIVICLFWHGTVMVSVDYGDFYNNIQYHGVSFLSFSRTQ